jgi:hypothetical protein
MKNKLIAYLAIATAVCFAACAHHIGKKAIGIGGPTQTHTPTPGPTGNVVVVQAPDGGCVGATWQINGGPWFPVGPTPRQFTIGPKTLCVAAQNQPTECIPITVLDDITLKYKITCN